MNIEPFRFSTVPEGDVGPGLYDFGWDEERRKALNFKAGLSSYSRLSRFAEPGRTIAYKTALIGNLVSDMLLIPASLPAKYYFHHEDMKYNTRAGKTFRDNWHKKNPGMELVRPKERLEAESLVRAVMEDPSCERAIQVKGMCEVGIVADVYGLRFRSWIDKLTRRAVIDVKTTQCQNQAEFKSRIRLYRYDVQAALYLDSCKALGLEVTNFGWLVVSKRSKTAWMQRITQDQLEDGRRWLKDMSSAYKAHGLLEQQLKDTVTHNIGKIKERSKNDTEAR